MLEEDYQPAFVPLGTSEEMASPKYVNMLAEQFTENLKWNSGINLYNKHGHIPEESLVSAFNQIQTQSLEGKLDSEHPTKIFTFHADENDVVSLGSTKNQIGFYLTFCKQFKNFLESVPEYANAEHVQKLLGFLDEGLKKNPGRILGEVFDLYKQDHENPDPVFLSNRPLGYNVSRLLSINFANARNMPYQGEIEATSTTEDFPSLIPILNFQHPKPFKDGEDDLAAIKLIGYSPREGDEESKKLAQVNRGLIHAVYGFLREQAPFQEKRFETNLVIAAPLYAVKALECGWEISNWRKPSGLGDIHLREAFGDFSFETKDI